MNILLQKPFTNIKTMSSTITRQVLRSPVIEGAIIGQGLYNNKRSTLNTTAKSLILSYFQWKYSKTCLISDIQFIETNNEIEIQFYYYIISSVMRENKNNRNINKINTIKTNSINQLSNTFLTDLSKVLQNVYGKKVQLILNRIHYPYINAKIFSQYLSENAQKKTFLHFTQSILRFPSYKAKDLPAYIIGIKIILHGRLITEGVIPRKTIKSKIQGTFSPSPVQKNSAFEAQKMLFIDKGYTEIKNELGQFRISVEIAMQSQI